MTDATTPTVSKQDTFNWVYRGLAKQGFERSLDGAMCKYRDMDGRACSAGQLIPDHLYSIKLEGGTIKPVLTQFSSLAVIRVTSLIEQLGYDVEFVSQLQHDHDLSDRPAEMKLRLKQRAKEHGLKIPRIYPSRASSAAGRSAA